MSISGKNRIFSEEHKNKISITKCGQNNPMFGKIHTEKTKQRISISAKNRPKFECPHCNKLFNQLNLNRWHDDNCKFKK
jgi:ribosomal protein L37AE/L43A